MAKFIVTETVLRSYTVEADTAEEARQAVTNGEVDNGEDYDWEVTSVTPAGPNE